MKATHIWRLQVKTISGWETIGDRTNKSSAEYALRKCKLEDCRREYRILHGKIDWEVLDTDQQQEVS